jgi:oligopeptide/dipeptide ABC transporter ATP-binding protein
MNKSIISIKNLVKHFPVRQTLLGRSHQFIHAVNDVDIEIPAGSTIGLVGESGCGKTTIGKLIVGLEIPDSGEIYFAGQSIFDIMKKDRTEYSKKVQIVLQNPYGALNPRKRIFHTLHETLKVHHIVSTDKREQEILHLLKTVQISSESIYKYPFEFSGGQRQRLCIARALAVRPKLLICDEPVSSLDVSVQSQILKLLKELQKKYNLTYLFISHDLSVIYHMCDYIYIMYLGQIVEQGPVEQIFNQPQHPYTKALLSAVPIPDPTFKRKRIILEGEIPNPIQLPKGCFFYSRCSKKMSKCHSVSPPQVEVSPSHLSRCWLQKNTLQ